MTIDLLLPAGDYIDGHTGQTGAADTDKIERSAIQKRGDEAVPKTKEFRVTVPDEPGALAAICLALAERGVNIIAFQSFVEHGESLGRFVVNDPESALTVLSGLRTNFEQDDVAMVALPHRPGELGRAAACLGKNRININYSYSGVEPDSLQPVVVFGVDQATRAAGLLDELAAGAS